MERCLPPSVCACWWLRWGDPSPSLPHSGGQQSCIFHLLQAISMCSGSSCIKTLLSTRSWLTDWLEKLQIFSNCIEAEQRIIVYWELEAWIPKKIDSFDLENKDIDKVYLRKGLWASAIHKNPLGNSFENLFANPFANLFANIFANLFAKPFANFGVWLRVWLRVRLMKNLFFWYPFHP